MSEPCKRCGSTDGRHVGHHFDSELPVKRGDRVRIRAGAVIRTTRSSKREVVNKRARVITVHDVHGGMSEHVGYGPNKEDLWRHLNDPDVIWPGTGGYWHYAKMSDVEIVTTPSKDLP